MKQSVTFSEELGLARRSGIDTIGGISGFIGSCMSITQQLLTALFRAPLSFARQSQRSYFHLTTYLLVGSGVFALFVWILLEQQQPIKQAILDYLFPQSWHAISQQLFDFFFESQAKSVIANMILSGSLVVSSVFLFPLKEFYSSSFEKDLALPNGTPKEFPLLHQAWEESRLLLFYITAQLVILWIGYYPYQWCHWLSIVLSYFFLFFTFGIDLISPTLQRHRISYSKIVKILSKNILLTLSFGTLFSLPAILLGFWVLTLEELTLVEMASILFFVNFILIAFSISAGTHIASNLVAECQASTQVSRGVKAFGYIALLVLFTTSAFLHSRLVKSMHHKSQLLKANYSVDWSSFSFDYTSLGDIFSGESIGKLKFNMQIENPTEFDLHFEPSILVLQKDELMISQVNIKSFTVPSGSVKNIEMTLDSVSNFGLLQNLQDLDKNWRIDLEVELWPGIPFIINVI